MLKRFFSFVLERLNFKFLLKWVMWLLMNLCRPIPLSWVVYTQLSSGLLRLLGDYFLIIKSICTLKIYLKECKLLTLSMFLAYNQPLFQLTQSQNINRFEFI